MIRFSRVCLIAVIALFTGLAAVGGGKVSHDKKRDKARYFYLKGAVSDAEGKKSEAYEYYKKAFQTDPTFEEAAFYYGYSRGSLYEDTFSSPAEMKRSLSYMSPLVESYPSDTQAVECYAFCAALADTIPEALRVYSRLVSLRPGLSKLYVPLAYYYKSSGQTDSAVHALREYERLEGISSETTVRKVSYWLSEADTLAALDEVRAYADANPGDAEAIIEQAMLYNLLNRNDSAIIILEDALKRYPDNSHMKFGIALLYADRGDSVRFHKLVDEAFRGPELEYEDHMGMLHAYGNKIQSSQEDYSESDRLFEYAASLYPEDADLFDYYAGYEITKKDYKAAYEREKRALELDPKEPSYLVKMMSFGIFTGDTEGPMKAYENYISSGGATNFNLEMTYLTAVQTAKEYNKALAAIDTMLAAHADRNPRFTIASTLTEEDMEWLKRNYHNVGEYAIYALYEAAGDIYAKMAGREQDAVRAYENALLVSREEEPNVLNNYAYYIVETLKAAPGSEMFEKAKEMSQKSIKLTESDPVSTYCDTYAWILFKEGDYKSALDYQELAMELEGDHVASEEYYLHYGDILYMNGREEEALEQWEKGLLLAPDDAALKERVSKKAIEKPETKQ